VSGARIDVVTRDERRGADPVVRGSVTTASDGSFRYTARAVASRELQFGWRSHLNDSRFAANAYLGLRARASAKLRAAPHRVRVGRTVRLFGTLRGTSRRGVTVILQGRARARAGSGPSPTPRRAAAGAFTCATAFATRPRAAARSSFARASGPGPRFPYETGYSNRVTVRVA
jgi:hypothetical protein